MPFFHPVSLHVASRTLHRVIRQLRLHSNQGWQWGGTPEYLSQNRNEIRSKQKRRENSLDISPSPCIIVSNTTTAIDTFNKHKYRLETFHTTRRRRDRSKKNPDCLTN